MPELLKAVRFHWDRSSVPKTYPVHTTQQVFKTFNKVMVEFIWRVAAFEKLPFEQYEVRMLMNDITVGGKSLSDHDAIINLIHGAVFLSKRLKKHQFTTNKKFFCTLQAILAHSTDRKAEYGLFRGEGKLIDQTPVFDMGKYDVCSPPTTIEGGLELNQCYAEGVNAINSRIESPLERAMVFFLFCNLHHFFFTNNMRTAFFMMNGILMSSGINPLVIPDGRVEEFHEIMSRFYLTKYGQEVMAFLISCHHEQGKMK